MEDQVPTSVFMIILAVVVALSLFGVFMGGNMRRRLACWLRGREVDPFEPDRTILEEEMAIPPPPSIPKSGPERHAHGGHAGHGTPARLERKAFPAHRSG